MYAIKCLNNGKYTKKYVAKSGEKESYTNDINKVRFFSTKESAEDAACENEIVVDFN